MKALNENTEKLIIEFDKLDFYNICNFFREHGQDKIKSMCSDEQTFNSINEFVQLEDTEKGLFDEISRVLKVTD